MTRASGVKVAQHPKGFTLMPAQVGTHDGGGGRILRHENRMPVASSEVTDSQRMCRREWATDLQKGEAAGDECAKRTEAASGGFANWVDGKTGRRQASDLQGVGSAGAPG